MMLIVMIILTLIILNIYLILTCNKLSKENMKLLMENMAIYELYLERNK